MVHEVEDILDFTLLEPSRVDLIADYVEDHFDFVLHCERTARHYQGDYEQMDRNRVRILLPGNRLSYSMYTGKQKLSSRDNSCCIFKSEPLTA